ncbi:TPA: glutamate racemase [Burkholderia cepacia]|uniref:glutamate racemase n=1 Tax=Burkholderia cepacia TaxID=292 RepID=UPI0007558918|nr:glutamate racemase [Burkholderia cepacia]HDR9763087.1 glutamate racemase [Burkholderia cepacia ATCC 25416]KVS30811.1 glutamate racemase [Burkholderia cepacia]MCA8124198.1 glutamate racemase [Burkholderia cepacia]MCA8284288.1 glutamate racemase [Burkholderia cepacia]MCA8363950.1 glutamate racemase [Burkholderia cepacia]
MSTSSVIAATSTTVAPIGIFDSGLGGLSVLRAARAQLPDESFIYVADSHHAPYGPRDEAFITERTLAIGEWLAREGAKALVIACNTATARAIAAIREHLPMPLVGVEPGIKPAVAVSASGVAGVLATQSTLNSPRFQALLDRYGAGRRFICQPGHGLVEAIERGDTNSPALRALLDSYLQPMLDDGADTLVLGCTHYPFFTETIRDLVGDRLTIVDTSDAIARQLARILDERNLRAPAGTRAAPPRFCSTSDGRQLQVLASTLLGLAAPVESVTISSPNARACATA